LTRLAAPRPDDDAGRLAEADALWQRTGHLLGHLANGYLRVRLAGQPGADFAHPLRMLGVRLGGTRHAAGALWYLSSDPPLSTVEVRTLGGFLVLRDGVPVIAETVALPQGP
jgi:hypothetical protein